VDTEHYRGDLTAALLRVERLEAELAAFRADPTYERVDAAEEDLARARARSRRARRILPRALVASFVLTGAFALTNPALAPAVQLLGYALAILGASSAVVVLVALLVLTAQGSRPRQLRALERALRLAKADVGMRREARLRVADDGASGAPPGAVELDDGDLDERRVPLAHAPRA
jgi:hypothetical protein